MVARELGHAEPPAPPVPRMAEFGSVAQAQDWRRWHGGWIFVSDDGVFLWFNLDSTMGDVMRHPRWTHGMSGRFL